MNRIIVIGNGFDKAHGLKTGYQDFIDDYWTKVSGSICSGYHRWTETEYGVTTHLKPYQDEFLKLQIYPAQQHKDVKTSLPRTQAPYREILERIETFNLNQAAYDACLLFENKFFEHISSRCSLTNWLDIENEYYGKLKELLTEENAELRHEKVRELNRDFEAVKKRLESYLTQIVSETPGKPIPSIREAFDSLIEPDEVAYGKQEAFMNSIPEPKNLTLNVVESEASPDLFFGRTDKERAQRYLQHQLRDDAFKKKYCRPAETLILNFNYTRTAKLYARDNDKIINIHGELGCDRNPIIFGYGDELDDDYKRIEKLQDNDFLENIKSVRYHETGNYRQLLGFIESEPYQIITMGHSCGNSDRTLLNTLFEHPNCISVKVCYHQREDGTDDYSHLIRNLSRNFNDKAAMRDKVVQRAMLTVGTCCRKGVKRNVFCPLPCKNGRWTKANISTWSGINPK